MDDGEPTWGVAHVVARRQWLLDELAFVMNAEFYGPYDVAPRSHPNDGKVDVLRVEASMALARAATGAPQRPVQAVIFHTVTCRCDPLAKSISTSIDRWSCGSTVSAVEPRVD